MARALTLLGRGLRRRCPACGGAPVYCGAYALRASCPRCGLCLEREEGYYLGAMLLNLLAAELLVIGLVVLVFVRTWPYPPWDFLTWSSIVAAVVAPLGLYLVAKTVWIAFDLYFHPASRDEHRGQIEPASDSGPPTNG